MEESQIKTRSTSPIAILVLVFIYYFLKFAMESAVSGVSMAVVEGVSSGFSGSSSIRKAMLISPVFVYLAFAVLYLASGLLKLSKHRLAGAVEETFQFHICFFIVSLIAFFLCGPLTVPMFEETAVGGFIMAVGKCLPLLLICVFTWRYAAAGKPEINNSVANALINTQA